MKLDYASLKASMQLCCTLKIGPLMILGLMAGLLLCAQTPPSKDIPASELKGMPARVAPTEYQAHAQAGKVTVAAEFLGHTEHLQRRLRAREVVMAFWSPELATSLATTHIPLARVPAEVTRRGRVTNVGG